MVEQTRRTGDPGSESFDLERYPFYQVNRVLSRYNLIIERELRKIDVDIPTWRVLMILGERAPRSIGQIARAGVVNLSTMMRIVERMTNAGLVSRNPSATDARVIDVALTQAGAGLSSGAGGVRGAGFGAAADAARATERQPGSDDGLGRFRAI